MNNFRKTPNILLKKTSLNQNVRKRDLVKIAIENQEIFKRLENKRSAYNIKLWQKNREISVKYLANISEYPLLRNSSEFERTQIKTENINKRTKKWCYTTNTGFGEFNKDSENESSFVFSLIWQFLRFIEKPSTSFNKNRKIVIYKKSRVIRQRKFLIEIFIDKQLIEVILVFLVFWGV